MTAYKFYKTNNKMQLKIKYSFALLSLILSLLSCKKEGEKKVENNKLFTKVSNSGIDFTNTITNTKDLNIFTYRNFYNGGGVSIADINNDGLSDVYLTSNLGKNKLFLNKGDFKFEDITEKSKTGGSHSWSTGVVIIDINNDNLLDIYVCNAGNVVGDNRKNELFINNGDLTFTEKADEYGLADNGFTTHAAFFDYDSDGDLDVYILNNSFIPVSSLGFENKRNVREIDWNINPIFIGGGDKLLRNDSGKFVDISEDAGIYGSLIGFGLGVTIGDVNNDFLPDIYVSNDFYERDYLYINNGDGTFKENIKDWIQHLSLSSMGADMADINNDGYPEIFVTDMLPENDQRLKMTSDFESFDIYNLKKQRDFHNQYMQNTLQLNNQNNTFSEIAMYSGIAKTDWSWGALLFDMDNDGYKDIYVSNGIYHDLTNQEFMDFFANEIIQKMTISGKKEEFQSVIDKMPSTPILNYALKNNHDLTFTNQAKEWGFEELSFSNGASYGDLDNDGDLDLVVNNVNQPAFVFKNNSNEILKNNYLKIKLKGTESNTYAVGSLVKIFIGDQVLRQELIPSRGFQSSIDYAMVFGLGQNKKIDSVQIIWPNKKSQVLKNVGLNETLELAYNDEQATFFKEKTSIEKKLFTEVPITIEANNENNYIDFNYEGLIPKMSSKEGPTISVADINKDGFDDIFIGGAKEENAFVYLQKSSGNLSKSNPENFISDKGFEDTASAFFDADGDGDMDLYIGSGGNEEYENFDLLTDRLYFNNGKGVFERNINALPKFQYNTSIVAPNDFDEDGDIDLFIGSSSVSGTYGINPESFLLENDGNGNFKDITDSKAFDVKKIGMITGAEWQDITGNGKKDLIVVGEWMAPTIFENTGRRLRKYESNIDTLTGLWYALKAEDLNNDGKIDLVLGNRGTNFFCETSAEKPVKMFINDFDNNGTIEQILTRNIDGKDIPIPLRREMSGQMSSLKKTILKFEDYATKSVQELFSEEIINNSLIKTANTFESIIAYNNGDGTFRISVLPMRAQLSCINQILTNDLNKDGYIDLILAGNNFNYKPQFGRADASYGDVLLGSANGEFSWLPNKKSGFFVKGQVRSLKWLHDKNNTNYIIVGRNDEQPKLFKLHE